MYLFGHPRGLSFFEITGASVYFTENFRYNLTHYQSENFTDSFLHHIFESENFRFPFFYEK